MKFACIALIATVSAQVTCTDGGEECADAGGCCGYLTEAEGEAARACADGAGAAAEYDGEGVFTCDAPVVEEEGASKLAAGAFAVVAAIYMA